MKNSQSTLYARLGFKHSFKTDGRHTLTVQTVDNPKPEPHMVMPRWGLYAPSVTFTREVPFEKFYLKLDDGHVSTFGNQITIESERLMTKTPANPNPKGLFLSVYKHKDKNKGFMIREDEHATAAFAIEIAKNEIEVAKQQIGALSKELERLQLSIPSQIEAIKEMLSKLEKIPEPTFPLTARP